MEGRREGREEDGRVGKRREKKGRGGEGRGGEGSHRLHPLQKILQAPLVQTCIA